MTTRELNLLNQHFSQLTHIFWYGHMTYLSIMLTFFLPKRQFKLKITVWVFIVIYKNNNDVYAKFYEKNLLISNT